MNHAYEEHLPDELEFVVDLLRAQRPQADPLQLDQIKQRAIAQADQPRRPLGLAKPRIAAILTILGLAAGTGGALAVATSSSPNRGAASGQYKPGWGCGDKNHTHTGPPGNPRVKSPC